MNYAKCGRDIVDMKVIVQPRSSQPALQISLGDGEAGGLSARVHLIFEAVFLIGWRVMGVTDLSASLTRSRFDLAEFDSLMVLLLMSWCLCRSRDGRRTYVPGAHLRRLMVSMNMPFDAAADHVTGERGTEGIIQGPFTDNAGGLISVATEHVTGEEQELRAAAATLQSAGGVLVKPHMCKYCRTCLPGLRQGNVSNITDQCQPLFTYLRVIIRMNSIED